LGKDDKIVTVEPQLPGATERWQAMLALIEKRAAISTRYRRHLRRRDDA